MDSEDFRISVDKVDKPDAKCCARNCSASEADSKFLFSFPPVSNKKSKKRCQVWVRKAGNVELLKYKLTDLSEKFYLCSSHFSDWVADDDESHRKILSTAVPTNFDCTPIRFDVINISFSETSELEKTSDEIHAKENGNESQAEVIENKSESEHEGKDKCLQPQLEEPNKDHEAEDSCVSVTADKTGSGSQDNVIDPEPETKEKESDSIAMNNLTDHSVNLNDDKSQTDSTESDLSDKTKEVEPQLNRNNLNSSGEKSDSESQAKENTSSFASSASSTNQTDLVKSPGKPLTESATQSESIVVKQEVTTEDHVDQVDSPSLQEKTTEPMQETDTPKTLSPQKNTTASPGKRVRKSFTGRKRDTPTRKAKNDACDRLSGKIQGKKDMDDSEPEKKKIKIIGPKKKIVKRVDKSNSIKTIVPKASTDAIERTVARSFIVSKDILSKLGSKLGSLAKQPLSVNEMVSEKSPIITGVFSNYQSPQGKSKTPMITNIRSLVQLNGVESPSKRTDSNLAKDLNTSPNSYSYNYNPFASSVEPILRTTGTQTSVARTHKFLNILDSDKKLSIFSGIPSFEVLENITDATLKMVMNSEAMRSEIQPTMREWIIVTCTKFMLNISVEALAVMYGLAEDECSRIVEKTSLFLRRTLSLPDGQKYVWSLPSEVLNGIADFSDSAVNVS